jgi:CBS domain containing-hemolysin-like protein
VRKEREYKLNTKEQKERAKAGRWVVFITLWTFLLALSFSFLSETVVRNLKLGIAYIILLVIIIIGIIFDIIGIAVAASDEKPLNGMAAQKIPGAREAVELHKNAGAVSNFCNDVIGDICGIISGAAGAVIVARFVTFYPGIKGATAGILLSSLIAAVTVGGKAVGKNVAIKKASEITFRVGRILNLFHKRTSIKAVGNDKKNGGKR